VLPPIASCPHCRCSATAALLPPLLCQTRYRARSLVTKPCAAHSAGQADTVESTPSRPLCSAPHVCVHSRVGTVHWSPSVHHVDTWIPSPCLAHHPDTGVRTTPSSHALHVTPIATGPLHHMSARLLCHRAEPSHPFLSPSAAHVASTQCATIKGGPLIAYHPCQCPCPPPVSRHHCAHLCFLPCRPPLLSPCS
jgi:hypothetical protein